jgi:large subunit ribosomal protein L21
MAEKIIKKAVILTGGKQYLVHEGQELEVELLASSSTKSATFEPLLVIKGGDTAVGTPTVPEAKVTADITEPIVKAPKVTAIRYKAKKRVHKTKGHRQRLTRIKINKIS